MLRGSAMFCWADNVEPYVELRVLEGYQHPVMSFVFSQDRNWVGVTSCEMQKQESWCDHLLRDTRTGSALWHSPPMEKNISVRGHSGPPSISLPHIFWNVFRRSSQTSTTSMVLLIDALRKNPHHASHPRFVFHLSRFILFLLWRDSITPSVIIFPIVPVSFYFIISLSDCGIYKYLIWQESSHLILFGLPVR